MIMPGRPSEQEEEYFARQEFERRKQALATRAQSAIGEAQKQEAAVAQYRCPKCGAELIMVSYKGIEIDKCSQCQGIWLDCGELEQVLEGEQVFLSAGKRIFT
jgi:ribosomal protein L37AE/L43A